MTNIRPIVSPNEAGEGKSMLRTPTYREIGVKIRRRYLGTIIKKASLNTFVFGFFVFCIHSNQ